MAEPPKKKQKVDKQFQYRNFVATLNNYTHECVQKMKEFIEKHCEYGVFGKEVGESGTPHLQIYCELKGRMILTSIRKKTPHNIANIESRRSDIPKEAAGYCKKGPTRECDKPDAGWVYFYDHPHAEFDGYEFGSISLPGNRTDVMQNIDDLKTGKKTVKQIRNDNPLIYHQYGRLMEKIQDDYLSEQFRTWETKGIWLTGAEGVGKGNISFKKELLDDGTYKYHWNPKLDYLWKYDGSGDQAWQDTYTGQPYVVINEFRGQLKFNDLLRLVSADVVEVRRRGGSAIPWLPKLVVINSIKKPEEVYKNEMDDEPWGQFKRRFKVVKIRDSAHAKELAAANVAGDLFDYIS